jgi:predicted aspartyl protease
VRRREFLGAGAALIATAAAAAEPTTYFEGPGSATLPLKRAIDGKLYLSVPVMGRDLLMFLDTGATTVIDINVARKLSVPLVDTGQEGFGLTGVAGKRISTHVDLRLGPIEITGLPVDCLDLTQLRAVSRDNGMPDFDGVIGPNCWPNYGRRSTSGG